MFADIGDDFLISAESVESKQQKTPAIMPTQLNGRCCNMDDLGLIADKFGLQIFEDSAQALGARFKGKAAGTFVPSALSVSIRLRC